MHNVAAILVSTYMVLVDSNKLSLWMDFFFFFHSSVHLKKILFSIFIFDHLIYYLCLQVFKGFVSLFFRLHFLVCILVDVSPVMQAGTGIGAMLSATHGFNTGNILLLYFIMKGCLQSNDAHYTGIPFVQKHVKGPKWLPFVVGVSLVHL